MVLTEHATMQNGKRHTPSFTTRPFMRLNAQVIQYSQKAEWIDQEDSEEMEKFVARHYTTRLTCDEGSVHRVKYRSNPARLTSKNLFSHHT